MRPCHILRVFTRGESGGNLLGVVDDVTGLDDSGMQAIAADLGFSETVFLDWCTGEVPHARIFTPAVELPFAGHPLVGAAWTLSSLGPGTTDRLTCGVGEIPFRMEGEMAWVDTPMVSDVAPAEDAADRAEACGLPVPTAAWWARMPIPYFVAEYPSPEEVASASPDLDDLVDNGLEMCYLTSRRGSEVKVRFFAPAVGVPEDAATGSAAAALAAVLRHRGEAEGSLLIRQGDEIGHPSDIRLRWDARRAILGGTVVREETRVLES